MVQDNLKKKSPGKMLGLFFFLGFIGLHLAGLWILEPERERPRAPFLSPPAVQHFLFGMKEQAADFLWLRALQDFDYCEQEVAKQVCVSSGWLFRMLDLITDISPSFRMPYATGGLALTVLVNDFKGASVIFDKAVAAFPKDWAILSRAAYHALYEEHDKEKAAGLLLQAGNQGGPKWYYLLANRLTTEDGNLSFTQAMIEQLESETSPDPVLLKTLKERLERAKSGRPLKRTYEKDEQ